MTSGVALPSSPISCVICAYNEAPRLGAVLAVVVDDDDRRAQGVQLLDWILKSVRSFARLLNAVMDLLFQHGEEETLFTVEIGVEGTACIPGGRSDLLQLGRFETVTGEDLLRGLEQAGASLFRVSGFTKADGRGFPRP